MTVTEFLHKTYKKDGYNVRPRVKCADGFSISIQGGTYGHYCKPKGLVTFKPYGHTNVDVYEEVELGFPTYTGFIMRTMLWLAKKFPKQVKCNNRLIGEYAEEPSNPENTVYAYVPIEIVEKLIAVHGGIVAIQDNTDPEKYNKIGVDLS